MSTCSKLYWQIFLQDHDNLLVLAWDKRFSTVKDYITRNNLQNVGDVHHEEFTHDLIIQLGKHDFVGTALIPLPCRSYENPIKREIIFDIPKEKLKELIANKEGWHCESHLTKKKRLSNSFTTSKPAQNLSGDSNKRFQDNLGGISPVPRSNNKNRKQVSRVDKTFSHEPKATSTPIKLQSDENESAESSDGSYHTPPDLSPLRSVQTMKNKSHMNTESGYGTLTSNLEMSNSNEDLMNVE